MGRRNANEVQNFNNNARKVVNAFGLALVAVTGILLATNGSFASARYLPTRADQADVDVLKAMIHEILFRPDIDRADLERALYSSRQQQHFGSRGFNQQRAATDMIAVQRRASPPEGNDALESPLYGGGTIGNSFIRSFAMDQSKGGISAEDR